MTMARWNVVLLLLALLCCASATRVVFKNRLQPAGNGDQQTLSAAQIEDKQEVVPNTADTEDYSQDGNGENADQESDAHAIPTEESETVNDNNNDNNDNNDNANAITNENNVDDALDQSEENQVPDINELMPSDFPSFRQTAQDVPVDMIITNSPMVADKTSGTILSDKLQTNSPSLSSGGGAGGAVNYGGSVIQGAKAKVDPVKIPVEYGAPVRVEYGRTVPPVAQIPVPKLVQYGGVVNPPVNYGGQVKPVPAPTPAPAPAPVIYGGAVPAPSAPQESPATKALAQEISKLHTEHDELNSRIHELENGAYPEWALKQSACPDGWKNLGYNAEEARVYCESPASGETPGNERCKGVAKFPQVYDRCGWSRHCKAPWIKYHCFPATPSPPDVTALSPVPTSGMSDAQVKDAEALRQQILKEEKNNPLESLTGVPNPPPLNLPPVPPAPTPPPVLNKKAWL